MPGTAGTKAQESRSGAGVVPAPSPGGARQRPALTGARDVLWPRGFSRTLTTAFPTLRPRLKAPQPRGARCWCTPPASRWRKLDNLQGVNCTIQFNLHNYLSCVVPTHPRGWVLYGTVHSPVSG